MTSPPSRRLLLAGLATLTVGPALAAPAPSRSAADLGDNPVARLFQPLSAPLPDLALESVQGERRLSAYRGKTLLVPLWAEWCADCLLEMADFAALQKRFGGARFQITPVLTDGKAGLDASRAAFLLAKVGGGGLTGLIEPRGGAELARAFCQDAAGGERFALPCILLVDPHGQVVGRHIGLASAPGVDPHTGRTLWSTPAAAAFCAALASGALPERRG